MVELKVYTGGSVSSTEYDAAYLGDRVLGRTLKDAVVMYEANVRQGTHKTKTRSEVAGPNRKMWKQKHTGRARMGTKKVVHWRGGGTAFGPRPRDYSYHMPVKARRVALKNAVMTKFQDGEVCVADGLPADKPSTKSAFSILSALGVQGSATVVTSAVDRTVWLSLRNVPNVDVAPLSDLNAHQVLLRRHLVFTPAALDELAARLPEQRRDAAAAG